jgi:hypothetical protein
MNARLDVTLGGRLVVREGNRERRQKSQHDNRRAKQKRRRSASR